VAVSAKQILDLIKRQDYKCALSGRALTPETASIDHIVPLSRGGAHSLENIWIVDVTMNAMKGTLLVEEFVAACKDVAERHCLVKDIA
jgi:5-methylcytosine-specific restriction endonuclease McrA